MNNDIIKNLSKELNINEKSVINTLKLLEEGNTIPFIARYRKEATNGLDEEQIRKIEEQYRYQLNLENRKQDVIRLIDEKQLLTPDLKNDILNCTKLVEVEDLYRPFKEKKKTKATEAIAAGLENLASTILSLPTNLDINQEALKYINDKVLTVSEAITGAGYIIAEKISDNAIYRKWIRNYIYNNAMIESKLKKNAVDEFKTYEMYYSYQEKIKDIKPHRVLAINRGEDNKILTVSFTYNEEDLFKYLLSKITNNKETNVLNIIELSIKDSLKRLILPSVEREIRSEITEISEDQAISVFGLNLEKLLLTPPLKERNVLGFDPAYRTGCKLAILDKTGKFLDKTVIYPHEPRNDYEGSKKILLNLIDKYNIDIIAIGNGTASRESEAFVSNVIKESSKKVEYIIVSEAGASVYSASPLAIKEFPDLHVEERSAISIGRRIQDPLSELVKIDTKSIGIGQYQHDVSTKKLDESLQFVVSKVVNQVGVNINTASASILSFISGLTKSSIKNIIDYRDKKGKIKNRAELAKIKGMTDNIFKQSVGFMRIIDGDNVLDKTKVHPESYDKALQLLKHLEIDYNLIGTEEIKEKLANIDKQKISKDLNIDNYTLEDIINSFQNPALDPRDNYPQPILKSDILTLEDLKVGMKLQGTVRNVVDFGAFVDIGLKNDGLVHISKMTNKYIKHPLEVVNVGDIVECYVDEIFMDKKKVSLSFKNIEGVK